jgi:hypothetical protein
MGKMGFDGENGFGYKEKMELDIMRRWSCM